MEFEQLKDSMTATMPNSMAVTYLNKNDGSIYLRYDDIAGDRLLVEIELTRPLGEEILIASGTQKGVCWYLSPEICQWLGMVSTLIVDYKGQ
jgi:hypothetical protein